MAKIPNVTVCKGYTSKRNPNGKTKYKKDGDPDRTYYGWRLTWWHNGKKHFEPTGTKDKSIALMMAVQKRQSFERRAVGLETDTTENVAKPITEHMEDWFAAIQTKSKYAKEAKRDLTRMQKALNWKTILDIRRDQVEKFLRGLTVIKTGEPAKSKTKNLFLGYLKSFLIWCKERDRVQEEFAAKIEAIPLESVRDAAEKRALSLDEINKLLESVPEDRGMKYLLAICTGLRSGEIGKLRRENFTWDPPTVLLAGKHTKNGKDASQPLDQATAETLRPYVEKKTGIIWPRSQHAARTLQRDLKAIGIDPEGMDFHGLRRTLVTLAWRSGLEPQMSQDVARHSDMKTNLKYLKLDDTDKRLAVERIMSGVRLK